MSGGRGVPLGRTSVRSLSYSYVLLAHRPLMQSAGSIRMTRGSTHTRRHWKSGKPRAVLLDGDVGPGESILTRLGLFNRYRRIYDDMVDLTEMNIYPASRTHNMGWSLPTHYCL